MDVTRTSMMHAAAPHFLWPFAVRYAAHQINLHPKVSMPETSPALLWTGKVRDASAFRVWGSRAFVHDLSADKLSLDVTFHESVPYYRLFPYRTPSLPSPPHFLVDAVKPVEVAGDSGTGAGAESGCADSGGATRVGGERGGAATGGAEPGGAATEGAEPGGAATGGAGPGGPSLGVLSLGVLPTLSTGAARVVCPALEAYGWSWSFFDCNGCCAVGSRGARPGSAGAAGPAGTTGAGAKATVLSPGGGPAGLVLLVLLEVLQLEVLLVLVLPLRVLVLFLLCLESPRGLGLTAGLPLPAPPPYTGPTGALAEPQSDSLRAASPTVTRLLANVVTDPSFESTDASALVAELVDFAARCRLDYAASLVAESASVCPPSVGAPTLTRFPPPGANIVSGMWIFRVKRPPGSPPVFNARYVASGFGQQQGVDYFQTFSPTRR
ncbi:unnamed protein product [Closterium sp. NIES-64]|nr:unnamed protein product [Closterium sp. NIES-64]